MAQLVDAALEALPPCLWIGSIDRHGGQRALVNPPHACARCRTAHSFGFITLDASVGNRFICLRCWGRATGE